MSAVDEMVDGRGGVRPHWRAVLGVLAALDPGQLADRTHRLDRAVEEDGPSVWRCDPVPLPIPSAEFAELEAGLCQRAMLLEAILADAYGPQSMLASGALPPVLVHANPGFLRACRATPALPGCFLQAYAADLVRSPDGRWRVLADRTGGALGIGYARESRRLLARVLPELFRPAQVRQLRPFFEAWQDALIRAAAPVDGRASLVAMLTHGVGDPHWPEHLALSRDLACALVQARDLTARDGVLYLKTLGGLQQVDVLLRRVPGLGLDTLELPGSGLAGLGITGLLDAARHGAVRVLNHPGAALIEAPALAAFLPALCRSLLGEPLRLATVPTLWMADDSARRMVAQGFQRWSVRSATDPLVPLEPLGTLRTDARIALEQAIAARPWAFAASTHVPPSLAPCHGPGGLSPRPVVLRLFLMHDGTAWRMMQGGLARVLDPGEHVTEALPPGAIVKDVWVLRHDNQDILGPELPMAPRVSIQRSDGNLPSRVADDFFWLGRYVERLEAQARLGRAWLLRRARGAPLPREMAELDVLAQCLTGAGLLQEAPDAPLDHPGLEHAVGRSLHPGGMAAQQLEQAARLIEAVRDRLTIETHGAFSHAVRAARDDMDEVARPDAPGLDSLVHAMTGLQRLATTVAGVAAEGMVRGGGWLFLDLGRRIERATLTAHMLATLLQQPPARMDGTLRLVLELCDSAITYRGRYMSMLQPAPALDLVLSDVSNPRALAYQFEQAARLLRQAGAPGDGLAEETDGLHRRVDAMVARVVDAADPVAAAASLSPMLRAVGHETGALSDRITRRFFALLPAMQSVGLELA